MKVNFENIDSFYAMNLNGGKGKIGARMQAGNGYKIMESVIPVGASIGLHTHDKSIEFDYVLSGKGIATCDGAEETLRKGEVHCCPSGSAHSIENTGDENLVLITIVTECK